MRYRLSRKRKSQIKNYLFFIPLTLLLSACRSGVKDRDISLAQESLTPSTYSTTVEENNSSNAESPENFQPWGDFPMEELLPQIQILFGENFELLAALSRVEGALAQAQIAGADRFPEFTASLGGAKTRQNFIGLPIPGSSGPLAARFTSYNLTFATQWEIDIWGRLKSAREASLLSYESLQADFQWLKHSLLSSYMQMWVNAQYTRETQNLASQIVLNRNETVRTLRDRYNKGLTGGNNVRNAQIVFKTVLSNEVQAEKLHRDSLRNLESILGGYPEGRLKILGELPKQLMPIQHGLPSDLLETRPDIVAAKKRLLSAGKRVEQSEASMFPRFALTGSTGTSSDQLSDLTDLDFSVWSIGGNVARPIFDYGKLRASVNISKANEREVFARYLQSIQNAFIEVETALDNENVLAQSLQMADENLIESERLLASEKQKYNLGLGNRISILESEYALLQAKQRRLDIFSQHLLNRILLTASLGIEYRMDQKQDDTLISHHK